MVERGSHGYQVCFDSRRILHSGHNAIRNVSLLLLFFPSFGCSMVCVSLVCKTSIIYFADGNRSQWVRLTNFIPQHRHIRVKKMIHNPIRYFHTVTHTSTTVYSVLCGLPVGGHTQQAGVHRDKEPHKSHTSHKIRPSYSKTWQLPSFFDFTVLQWYFLLSCVVVIHHVVLKRRP